MIFKSTKLGLLFDPTQLETPQWMHSYAQAPHLIDMGDFFRVYFSTRPPQEPNGYFVSYSAFFDLDKDLKTVRSISKTPLLELGDRGTFDEFGIYPVSILKESDNNYLMYYAGWTRCQSVPFNTAIGLAKSQDGASFERVYNGQIIPYSADEPFVISGPKIRKYNGLYYLFYIAGKKWVLDNGRPEPVYRIRLALSEDGLSWNRVNKDLIDVKLEEDEAQASPDVIFLNGEYHMFFCYRRSKDYRNRDNGYRIGYARSKNLVDWTREDECLDLDVSDEGWDSEMISYPHAFISDDQLYLMYLGNMVGRSGIGLAKLSRDDS